jgi:hypothetical protein
MHQQHVWNLALNQHPDAGRRSRCCGMHMHAVSVLHACTCCQCPACMHMLPVSCMHAHAASVLHACTCCQCPACMHMLPVSCLHAAGIDTALVNLGARPQCGWCY